ncbi:MAG: lysophospholipid acyltransferase family protein [Bacteroidota bacterium]|nr:lysophospholipid acyltransferase family protein [Bacteroidota bacterium]
MNLIYLFLKLLSYLPLSVLYLIAKCLNLFCFYLFSYREKVVIENLQNSLLEKSQKEIRKLTKQFFSHFFSIIMEIVKMITADKSFFMKHVHYKNLELLHKFSKKNQSIIIVLGHMNNWEWALASISIVAKQKVLGVYKKINNSFFSKIILNSRSRFGATLVTMEDSMRKIIDSQDECKIIGLIADQSPTLSVNNYWTTFLNQETPVFLGPEKIAKKMNYPVVFYDMKKIRNGHYEVELEILESAPSITEDGDITEKFIKRLEKQIVESPENWLWTHRRWKHKR